MFLEINAVEQMFIYQRYSDHLKLMKEKIDNYFPDSNIERQNWVIKPFIMSEVYDVNKI